MSKDVFGLPVESLVACLPKAPEGCARLLFRAVVAWPGGPPQRQDLWFVPVGGSFAPLESDPGDVEQSLSGAAVADHPFVNLTPLIQAAKQHFAAETGVLAVVAALFWESASGEWSCRLLGSDVRRRFRENAAKVCELLGGPECLVPEEPALGVGADLAEIPGPGATDGTPSGLADMVLDSDNIGDVLDHPTEWTPIGHLQDARARLLSGGFLGMSRDILWRLVKATEQAEQATEAVDTAEQIDALVRVNTEGGTNWLALWCQWSTLEEARVEIVENNQWKQLIRGVLASAGLATEGVRVANAPMRSRRAYGLSAEPTAEELAEAEVRFLVTQLFRPPYDNRVVTVEILQILGTGRSGAFTFLVQPRLRIDPTSDDPTGIESRIGRVCIVKLDDIGLIAREHCGFVNVVDRYLYSYAARISRVAKAHRLGALAYASIGGLDDYRPDPARSAGPISLREFVRGGLHPPYGQRATNELPNLGAVHDLIIALDRCVFADLHQDSRKGLLSWGHYADALPPDYRINGAHVAYVGRRPSDVPRVEFRAEMLNNEQLGACDGQVISVGRDSIYLAGNVYYPDDSNADSSTNGPWWKQRACWPSVSERDAAIGSNNALIRVERGGATRVGATYLGLIKHMRPEAMPLLQLVVYGMPQQETWVTWGDSFQRVLSCGYGAGEQVARSLPRYLLGLLRTNRVDVLAQIGSTHGDLNLTNVLVTFMSSIDPRGRDGKADPRCWLIDYEKTRLDGHTGRDYAQLEVGLRREVLATAYMDVCRQLTAAAEIDREQARMVVLAYHWTFEEQLVRYDTAPPSDDALNQEFETIALADDVIPLVTPFSSESGIASRVHLLRQELGETIRLRDFRLPTDSGIDDSAATRLVFAYLSSNLVLRCCYHILRFLRRLALDYGHTRMEQMWAQMLAGISVFKQRAEDRECLDSLEREVVFLASLVAADEIRWNLRPEEKGRLEELQREVD